MNILAIECSTRTASIAVGGIDESFESVNGPDGRETAVWLNEAVDAELRRRQLASRDIGLFALTAGPGSFTGLRIAVTFAKLFCYCSQAKLVALDTLQVIAMQAKPRIDPKMPVHAVMDALRGEFFHASFRVNERGETQRLSPTKIVTRAELLGQFEARCAICGPASDGVRDALPPHVVFDGQHAVPEAATVAELALARHRDGQHDDAWKLTPHYYRKSYAEERVVRT